MGELVGIVSLLVAVAGIVVAWALGRRQIRLAELQLAQNSATNAEPDTARRIDVPDIGSGTGQPIELSIGCFKYWPLMDCPAGTEPHLVEGFSGPMVTLANEVAAKVGIRLKWQHILTHQFMNMENVEVDLVLGLFRTPRRDQFFWFSDPVYRIGLQGVCKAAAPALSKETLAKGEQKIIVQEAEVGWEFVMKELQRAERKANVYRVNSIMTHEMLDLLVNEKYDLAIADEVSCMHFLRTTAQDGRFRLVFPRPPQVFDVCIAAKKSLKLDYVAINRWLHEVRNHPMFLEYEVRSLQGFEHAIERCGLE